MRDEKHHWKHYGVDTKSRSKHSTQFQHTHYSLPKKWDNGKRNSKYFKDNNSCSNIAHMGANKRKDHSKYQAIPVIYKHAIIFYIGK